MHSIRHAIRRLAAVAFAAMAFGAAIQAAPASAGVSTYDGLPLKASAVREGKTLVYTVNWTCTKGYTCDSLLYATTVAPRYSPSETATATLNEDFVSAGRAQHDVTGQQSITVRVPIVSDGIDEGNEFFWLRLELTHNLGQTATSPSHPVNIDIHNAKITILDGSTTATNCRSHGFCHQTNPTRTMSATTTIAPMSHSDHVENAGNGAQAIQQEAQTQQPQPQQESQGSVSGNPASSTTASSEAPRTGTTQSSPDGSQSVNRGSTVYRESCSLCTSNAG